MKQSARARRLQRHQRRTRNQGKLNLVSLMDIFTILVFFLMVSSSADNQLISDNPGILLPESSSEQRPQEAPTLVVTASEVLLNGRPLMTRAELEAIDTAVAPPLREALAQLAKTASPESVAEGAGGNDKAGWPIHILADQELPYQLLRKLMASCTNAGYSAISLAVTQTDPGEA